MVDSRKRGLKCRLSFSEPWPRLITKLHGEEVRIKGQSLSS